MKTTTKILLGLGAGAGALALLLWPRRSDAAELPADGLLALPGATQPVYQPGFGSSDLPPTAIGAAYHYTPGSHPDDVNGLTAICERLYGEQWPAIWIYDLNRELIGGNINLIKRGVPLWFPDALALANLSPELVDEFRARYAQLVEDYRAACSAASYPGGRGSRDCGKDAIIPVSVLVSTATVAPLALTH